MQILVFTRRRAAILVCLGATAIVGVVWAAERELEVRRSADSLSTQAAPLVPLHTPLGKPQPGDWLLSHPEPGQTLAEYVRGNPVTPSGKRSVIYIQPLGEFSKTERKIVLLTADFMGRYFDRPVKVKDDLPLSVIPDSARREHPVWGGKQILTSEILHKTLPSRMPADAAAYIAFTASDLWPGEGWNFVFGEASLRDRVGVWSLRRFGNPDDGEESYVLCLRRTLGTAVHETGHMFSLQHCTAYECVMCGSNNLGESDRRPIYPCPQCAGKIWYATSADPAAQYAKLAEFCKENNLAAEHEYYHKAQVLLGGKKP